MRFSILLHFIQQVEALEEDEKQQYESEYKVALLEFVDKLDVLVEAKEPVTEASRLLIGEFYRRVGRFDDAIECLQNYVFKNRVNQVIANKIAEKAQGSISEVFKLDMNEIEDSEEDIISDCSFNNRITLMPEDKIIDRTKYPTLATYNPKQIWDAVTKLQAKYPDMTEQQCLLNLEMDLAQMDQMALGD